MLKPFDRIALNDLLETQPNITVAEAYWALKTEGYKEPGLGRIEMVLQCYSAKTPLHKALLHELQANSN